MNKFVFAPVLLSIAGLLSGADTAMAQSHGHSGHSGHSVHSGHSGHSGSYHSGYHHGVYYHNGYHYGVGLYGYLPLYRYGGYRSYAPYYGDSSYYSYYPSYGVASDYYVQPVDTSASVRVIVPDPQARVWFDGTLTQQSGIERFFTTPPLATSGTYTVRVVWMRGGRSE